MSEMEKKIDALMRLAIAEDSDATAAAKAEILDLMKTESKYPRDNCGTETEIRRILTVLGMPEHIKGHRYNVEAIRLSVENPDLLEAMTSQLYPAVAKAFDTTASRVERAIRHGIELCWDRCDYEVLSRYFGNAISAVKGKPTNSEFIARIANMVRLRLNEVA